VPYPYTLFACALILFLVIKMIMGIRVSPEEELMGLDLGEHGMMAYPDFQQIAESGGSTMTMASDGED